MISEPSFVHQSVKTDPTAIPLINSDIIDNISINVKDSKINLFEEETIFFFCNEEPMTDDSAFNFGAYLSNRLNFIDDSYPNSNANIMISDYNFKGKLGRSAILHFKQHPYINFLCFVGCGLPDKLKNSNVNEIADEVVKVIKNNSLKNVSLYIDFITKDHIRQPCLSMIQTKCLLENILIQLSRDDRFKSQNNRLKSILESVTIYSSELNRPNTLINYVKIFSKSTFFAIQLVNSPPNYCNTSSLANASVEMAKKYFLDAKVLNLEEIEKLNMGCYLGVAKGSIFDPKFIHLTYKSQGCIKYKIAFVGKGLCFDSGGYNIKNASSDIQLMKFDMAGAAAVLGSAMAIGMIKPLNVEVHFIVAAAENMVSATSYRPGDVIVASNLKTVEVGNTDAEGRLTLADSLVYAEKLGVDFIVDIATLTGACVVALGEKIAGLFTSNDSLAKEIISCSELVGERMWRMPLDSVYRSSLDSKCADMNNISKTSKAGAITAALFLNEFVQNTKWAHIDIAGPAWNKNEETATGYGTRTLIQLVMEKSNS